MIHCKYGISCNICELVKNKTELSSCPRILSIGEEIEGNAVKKIMELRPVVTDDQFVEYINKDIQYWLNEHNKLIKTIDSYNNHSEEFACNWNYAYHWGLARIKRLNELITENAKILSTKGEILYNNLVKYGFLELSKVDLLSTNKQKEIVYLMIEKEIPYSITMLNYLGFIKRLSKNYALSQREIHKLLADWLEISERGIKGNLNVLNDYSKEDKLRYTSHLYLKEVEDDYNNLK